MSQTFPITIGMKRKSFFERLTGAINADESVFDDDKLIEDEEVEEQEESPDKENWMAEASGDAELSVDVFQTPSEVIVKTMVAGVQPDSLDIHITRESVTISGTRSESHTVSEDDYFHQELFWGTFSRTIVLPEEVDADGAEAEEHHGLITIHLPKIDKDRKTKLRVTSSR